MKTNQLSFKYSNTLTSQQKITNGMRLIKNYTYLNWNGKIYFTYE